MNQQERMLSIFNRLAGSVVKQYAIDTAKRVPTYDLAPYLMHNMHMINYKLTYIAIRIVKKVSAKAEVNTENIICELRNLIHGSVKDYIAKA